MVDCWNKKCSKDPLVNPHRIHVGDGDFVCDANCKREFEKQREHFFNEIAPSAALTEAWLLEKID